MAETPERPAVAAQQYIDHHRERYIDTLTHIRRAFGAGGSPSSALDLFDAELLRARHGVVSPRAVRRVLSDEND